MTVALSGGRVVTCDCGEKLVLDTEQEYAHYVWAARAGGGRSNLGFCPVKHGFDEAERRARSWSVVGALWVGGARRAG